MLKREIKYEDFNGEQASDIFYFNISKPEVLELQVEYEGGLSKFLESIIETKDSKELIKKFKEIVLLAYGQKTEDGKRFIKSDKLREEFSQTAAYQSLFMELASNEGAAVLFIQGVLPKDMAEQQDQDKPTTLPQPSAPPVPPS